VAAGRAVQLTSRVDDPPNAHPGAVMRSVTGGRAARGFPGSCGCPLRRLFDGLSQVHVPDGG